MISCSEAVNQLWEYVGAEVSPVDRDTIEEHLAFCLRCCGELEFAEELRRFLRASATMDLPPEVHDRLASFLAGLEPDRAS